MFKRLFALTNRDLRLIWRNHFFIAVLVLVVIYAVAIRFAIPAEINIKPTVVLWDATGTQMVREALLAHAEQAGTADRLVLVDSEEAYAEALAVSNRIGLKAVGATTLDRIEISYQGNESDRLKNILSADMQALAAGLRGDAGDYPQFETRLLRLDTPAPKIGFNDSMVPFAVFSEAVMVGMFLAAALLYSEKDERSLRAYRTSPGGLGEYILARSLAMGVLSLVFTIPLSLLTVGLVGNWLVIMPLVFLAVMVMTMLTLVVANLFDNISQFIYPALGLMFVLSMPMVSYFSPSISLPWIRALPTYPLLFALREAYFMPESTASLMAALAQLAATAVVVFPLAVVTFRRQMIARDV